MAASVVYLGPIKLEDRMEIRKELAERLLLKFNIETSECWSVLDSEQLHSKYFKKVILTDLKLDINLLGSLNHLLIDSVFAEYLFSLLYTRSLAVIKDSTGLYSAFLNIISGNPVSQISASDFNCESLISRHIGS